MKKLIGLFAALVLLTVSAMAAVTPDPWPAYATGGTDVGNTLCYSVISAHSANAGAPVVTYLNATSDKSGAIVQFYTVGKPVTITGVNSTVTVPAVTNGVTGFVQNAVVVIQHMATDTYERRIVDTGGTTTNIVLTVAPTTATALGDRIWVATTAGSIPVGAATKELNGNGIYAGQPQKPLLLEIDGTSACQINAVAATYVK